MDVGGKYRLLLGLKCEGPALRTDSEQVRSFRPSQSADIQISPVDTPWFCLAVSRLGLSRASSVLPATLSMR